MDPTIEEETIQMGSLLICMNSHRELCAVAKYGGLEIDIEVISHCCEYAYQRAEELSRQIKLILPNRK